MSMQIRLIVILLLCAGVSQAQISQGGKPWLLKTPTLFSEYIETVQLPSLDVDAARKEDAKRPDYPRYAAPVIADISTENAGFWTVKPGGDQIWHCAVESEGAEGLILLFDQFRLPDGAMLYAFTPDGNKILGGYTRESCSSSGKFTIGPFEGSKVVFELFLPAGKELSTTDFHLNRVDVVYNKEQGDQPEDFDDALPCNININCPEGAEYQTEKKGVARILMIFADGAAWCSGSLIANTDETPEPYFLTANHCQLLLPTPYFDQWVFYFHYESPICPTPASEPNSSTVLGCERVSYRMETDFMLLKLSPIPPNFDVYFNGWSRDDVTPIDSSVFIHHPSGDIKKISVDDHAASIHPQALNWGGVFGISPPHTHWRTIPDHGTFQPGSSGSPLLTPDHKIVGQLHGGSWNMFDQCIVTGSYFGMFSLSWDEGNFPDRRLRDWLDPSGTDKLEQDGYIQPEITSVSISGNVQTHWGQAMPGVMVVLSGDAADTVYTDFGGNFTIEDLETGMNYFVTPYKDDSYINGLTTFDLVLMSKHILGLEPLDSPWKIISSDTNGSNSVTTFDIVEGRKLILGIYSQLPNSAAWRFLPADQFFSDPENPFTTLLTEQLYYENLMLNVTNASFKGLKVGDTNNSANP